MQKIIPNAREEMIAQREARHFTDMQSAISEAMEVSRAVVDDDPDPYGYAQEIEREFGIDLVTPHWKAKPHDDKWLNRLKARSRKAVVATMFLQGKAIADIAAKAKVSEMTVRKDLDALGREWRKSYLSDVEQLASEDLTRLNYMLSKLASRIEKGEVSAIRAAVEIIDRKGRILGYDKGIQVDIEQYVREVAESAGYDPEAAVMIASKISVSFRT